MKGKKKKEKIENQDLGSWWSAVGETLDVDLIYSPGFPTVQFKFRDFPHWFGSYKTASGMFPWRNSPHESPHPLYGHYKPASKTETGSGPASSAPAPAQVLIPPGGPRLHQHLACSFHLFLLSLAIKSPLESSLCSPGTLSDTAFLGFSQSHPCCSWESDFPHAVTQCWIHWCSLLSPEWLSRVWHSTNL